MKTFEVEEVGIDWFFDLNCVLMRQME